jgi:hypothetical protein
MNKAAFSVKIFAIYLFVLGIALIGVPNVLLGLFGVPATGEIWIRVVGLLVIIIGYFYRLGAQQQWDGFFRATAVARFSVLLFFTAAAVLGIAPPVLVLFGAIDAAGAGWTLACLRGESAT